MKRLITLLAVWIAAFIPPLAGAGNYYTHGGFPAQGVPITSAPFRSEFDSIQSGFSKLPSFAGNGLKIWRINSGENGVEAVGLSASIVANTPSGLVTATDIQSAINQISSGSSVHSRNWYIKTANYSAIDQDYIFADTSSAPFSISLPPGVANNQIRIVDYAGYFGINQLTIIPNGSDKINGTASSITVSSAWATVTIIFVDGTIGWRAF